MTTSFKEVLEKDGVLAYTSKGASMLPLLREGRDVMVIRRGEPPYRKYDAVLFLRPNGQYILHRIMKVNGGSYYIIGDNCISGENVAEEQIIGVLTAIKRNGRTIDTSGRLYRMFVVFWWAIFPLRKAYKYVRRALSLAVHVRR